VVTGLSVKDDVALAVCDAEAAELVVSRRRKEARIRSTIGCPTGAEGSLPAPPVPVTLDGVL
jgi:hypothetical protein